MNVGNDIRDMIIADGETMDVFIGTEPDLPDEAVTIYMLPGQAPDPKFILNYPRLQIRVRARDYETAYNTAYRMLDDLVGRDPQIVNSSMYTAIYGVSDVFYLDKDTKNRFIFAFNIRLVVEANTSSNRKSLAGYEVYGSVIEQFVLDLGGPYSAEEYILKFDKFVNIDYPAMAGIGD